MAKKEYKLNPQTLTYEVVSAPLRLRFYRALRKILIGFILASIANFIISYFFYTPKMYRINEQHRELLLKYDLLSDKMSASRQKVLDVKHRDNSVYRALFSVDTLSIAGVYASYPDSKYKHLTNDRNSGVLENMWREVDALARMVYLETKSMDELELLAKDKGKMSSAIPAIWPINRKFLHNDHIGAFGWRNHPILGRYIRHNGIDLGADRGTPVYATGDGVVVKDNGSGRGFGKQILIDHSFGYVTRYAHLNKISVEIGQKVRRGEIIGEVGNTGQSVGAHLHYEVIYRGTPVNPINYFRRDMSEKEFERIIEKVKDTMYEYDGE